MNNKENESAKEYFPTLDLDTAIEYKIEADKEKIRIIIFCT